ncbi:zinc finger protein 318-like [Callithrix jacchus]
MTLFCVIWNLSLQIHKVLRFPRAEQIAFVVTIYLSKSDSVDIETSVSLKRNVRIPSPNILKTELTENVDRGLGGLEGTHQALDLLAGGMMPEEVEKSSQLDKQESLRLELNAINSVGLGPSPCLPDLVDFVTWTSGVQKDKLCSPLSEPGYASKCSSLEMGPLQLEILNASITEVAILQVDDDSGNPLNLVKPPVSRSPPREQVVEDNMVPQEMPEQEATVGATQDRTESSVHNYE